MDTPSNIADNLDQTDEDILTYTVSDEALEAAAGTERGEPATCGGGTTTYRGSLCC
jgi:hypothetical protein